MSKSLHYRIWPKDPAAHLFEVQLTVDEPDPSGQVFEIPAWVPGSYMIRDYTKNIVAIRAESDGLAVELECLDKSRWRAAPTQRPITIIVDIYAHDNSVRGAHLDTTHAYFNGPCVFLCVVGQEALPCNVDIAAPAAPVGADWRVATSMRRKSAEVYGFGTYEASSYEELIDHPVEIGQLTIGEFDVNGIPHAIAIRGKTRIDMARICHDLQRLCTAHLSLLGAPADLDRYLFLLYAPGSGYGGLEHRWSSSLVSARDNLPRRGETKISDEYRTFLGLVSHEYFHLWNIKRMKPAAFTPYKLDTESYTGLLWVFEGITSYYDDLTLLRSGLITAPEYLDLLGRMVTRVLRGSGRLKQSVEQSSFDAWTKFYKPDANSGNAIVSYYAKGALIAISLDLKIRIETKGRVTLDHVMRQCWKLWGETGVGMPESGFESVCAEVAGLDLSDFFDAAVRGTGELPLQALLARYGIEYNLRRANGKDDKGGKPATNGNGSDVWLGATITQQSDKAIFSSIVNGGPAELAGVAPGDEAVALDGLAFTATNWGRRLGTYHDGDTLELVLFRGDELITTEIQLANAPADTCYLEMLDDVDADTMARRSAWLEQ